MFPKLTRQQECIPVGCIPSAAVPVGGGGGRGVSEHALGRGYVSQHALGREVSAWGCVGPGGVCPGGWGWGV